jgi:hypothetical protein
MQVEPSRRIHGVGTVFRGTFTGAASEPWLGDIAWLAPGTTHDAIVRCSAFLPPQSGIPGVVCLAVRIVDAGGDDSMPEVDQDLTFFGVHRARAFRLVPAVRLHADRLLFSTVMTYSVAGRRVVFGARLGPETHLGDDASAYIETVGALRSWGGALDVLAAAPRAEWSLAGRVHDLHPYPLPGDLIRFRPGHTTQDLGLSGFGKFRDWLYSRTQNRGG